jgi:uncharacterized protein YbaR (Trm112 family)
MSQAVDPVGALACPATHLPLHPAPEAVIERLNTQVARRSLVTGAIDAGLLREDGAVLYPVRAGVAVLLIEAGIVLTAAERDG